MLSFLEVPRRCPQWQDILAGFLKIFVCCYFQMARENVRNNVIILFLWEVCGGWAGGGGGKNFEFFPESSIKYLGHPVVHAQICPKLQNFFVWCYNMSMVVPCCSAWSSNWPLYHPQPPPTTSNFLKDSRLCKMLTFHIQASFLWWLPLHPECVEHPQSCESRAHWIWIPFLMSTVQTGFRPTKVIFERPPPPTTRNIIQRNNNKRSQAPSLPKIINYNMRSFFPKYLNFSQDVIERESDLIFLTEVWQRKENPKHHAKIERMLEMKGIKYISNPHTGTKRGGGAAIAICHEQLMNNSWESNLLRLPPTIQSFLKPPSPFVFKIPILKLGYFCLFLYKQERVWLR